MTETENGKTTDFFIGKEVAGYKLVSLLGAGAMGAVYLGEHPQMGQAAVKLMPNPNPDLQERFKTELEILLKMTKLGLRHLAGVNHYEKSSADSPGGIIMPYLKGQTLHEYFQENSAKLARRRVFRGLIRMMADLEVAHDLGVVHRDIKPGNIMVLNPFEEKGELILCLFDFGISRPSTTSQMTRAGMTLGTPLWSAPEQFGKAREADCRADVFSCGLIIYNTLSPDKKPFFPELDGEDVAPEDVLALIRNVEWREAKLSGLPIELAGLVGKCIPENPDHRFRDMRELLGACRALHESYRLHKIGGVWAQLGTGSSEDTDSSRPPTQRRTILRGSGTSNKSPDQNDIVTVTDDDEAPAGEAAEDAKTREVPIEELFMAGSKGVLADGDGASAEDEVPAEEAGVETRQFPIEEIAPKLDMLAEGMVPKRKFPLKVIVAAAIGVVVLSVTSFFLVRGCDESSPKARTKVTTKVAHKPNPPQKIKAKPKKTLFQELDKLCLRLVRPKRGIEQKGRITNVAHCILKRILSIKGNLEARVQAMFALEKKYWDKVYPNMKKLITKKLKHLESWRNSELEKKPPDR